MVQAEGPPRRNGALVHTAKVATDFDGRLADAICHNSIVSNARYRSGRRAQIAQIISEEINEDLQRFVSGGCGPVPRWLIRRRPRLPTSTKHRQGGMGKAVASLVDEFSDLAAKRLSQKVKKVHVKQILAFLREAIARSSSIAVLVLGN